MNEVIDYVQTSNIIEDNKLIKCAALVITQLKKEERKTILEKKN